MDTRYRQIPEYKLEEDQQIKKEEEFKGKKNSDEEEFWTENPQQE